MEENNPIVATPWYAIRLFSLRLKAARGYFEEKGLEYFVPMHYVDVLDKENHIRHVLKPVVSNLIFVKCTMPDADLVELIKDSNIKMAILTRSRSDRTFCAIPAKQMHEFQIMCNPEIELRKYLSEEEARLKVGVPVLVKYGPLKGLTGKLVRSSKKYYLLKEVPGMGVMLKVSRWCCVSIEGEKS